MAEMRLREYSGRDLGIIFALDEVCFEPPFRFSARAMRQFAEARNALTVVAENEGRARLRVSALRTWREPARG